MYLGCLQNRSHFRGIYKTLRYNYNLNMFHGLEDPDPPVPETFTIQISDNA